MKEKRINTLKHKLEEQKNLLNEIKRDLKDSLPSIAHLKSDYYFNCSVVSFKNRDIIYYNLCVSRYQSAPKNCSLGNEETIKKHLLKCDSVHSYCSEEDEHFTKVVKHSKGKYYVCFDPLDGSQNLSLGLSVGYIFGIYEGEYIPYNKPPIVAAAYCLYGYQPQFVYVTNKILIIKSLIEPMHITTSCIKCPLNKRNVVYCANFKALTNIKNNPYRMEHSKIMCSTKITQRWTGCMVSDCHRLITNGGIFAYPSDSDGTKGKLRLLYECIPFAYIMTEIGGFATDSNNNNILETPLPHLNNIHLKIGFFCGTGKYI